MPASAIPVRIPDDATGFAFAGEGDRLIVFATRDHVINDQDIDARVVFQGLPDGEYVAQDVVLCEELTFSIMNGKGTLEVVLPRWSSRGFRTSFRVE